MKKLIAITFVAFVALFPADALAQSKETVEQDRGVLSFFWSLFSKDEAVEESVVRACSIRENVDLNTIRSQWIMWINEEREKRGVDALSVSSDLTKTAQLWSETLADRGVYDHKRPGQRAYYDHPRIRQWFFENGISFRQNRNFTFAEVVSGGNMSCIAGDDNCTHVLSKRLKENFRTIVAERHSRYHPNFGRLVNPFFEEVGIGVELSEDKSKYFLTLHFGTEAKGEITKDPSCE